MGDAADLDFDSQLEVWIAHQMGKCEGEGLCPYCGDNHEETEVPNEIHPGG